MSSEKETKKDKDQEKEKDKDKDKEEKMDDNSDNEIEENEKKIKKSKEEEDNSKEKNILIESDKDLNQENNNEIQMGEINGNEEIFKSKDDFSNLKKGKKRKKDFSEEKNKNNRKKNSKDIKRKKTQKEELCSDSEEIEESSEDKNKKHKNKLRKKASKNKSNGNSESISEEEEESRSSIEKKIKKKKKYKDSDDEKEDDDDRETKKSKKFKKDKSKKRKDSESDYEKDESKIKKKRHKKRDYSSEGESEENDEIRNKNKKKRRKEESISEEESEKPKKMKKKHKTKYDSSSDEESEKPKKKKKKKKKHKTKYDSSSEEESEKPKKKKKKHKTKYDSSSEEESENKKYKYKKPKYEESSSEEEYKKKTKKKRKNEESSSEDEEYNKRKHKRREAKYVKNGYSSQEEESEDMQKTKGKNKKKKYSTSDEEDDKNRKKKNKNSYKKKVDSSEEESEKNKKIIHKDRKNGKSSSEDKNKKKRKSSSEEEESSEEEKSINKLKKSKISINNNKDNNYDFNENEKNDQELVIKFGDKEKSIDTIIDFINDYNHTFQATEGKEELKKLIIEFQEKYAQFKDLKRFSIPVIGCISSGKSTILNYLLNLNNILEIGEDITTKCICVIRHQKNIPKPRIFKANLILRGENIFNIEEGEEIFENVSDVIKSQNKKIESGEIKSNFNDYFLIIKVDIPLFHGEYEKYADLFEFLDVPGLNEKNDLTNTGDKDDNENLGKNFYFRQIFPLFIMNVRFSLFIFNAENYDGISSDSIINEYLEGGIDKLKEQKKIDIQKIQVREEQLLQIKKQQKENRKKQIKICAMKSFQESEFILNKMDQIPNNTDETTVNTNFIKYIKKFVGERGINLNLNTNENELPLIAKKLNDEKTRFDSFKKYLMFYCDNSQENDNTSFYEYMLEKMNKDFALNLNANDVEEYEKSDKDEKSLNSEDETIYNEIKASVSKNESFIRFMNKRHFYHLKKLFKKNKKNGVYKRNECQLEKMIKQKMKYVIDDFLAFDKYSGLINSLAASFQIDLKFKSPSAIQKKLVEMKKKGNIMIDPIDSINKFNTFVEKIYSLEKGNKSIEKIKNHYTQIFNYFKYTSAIRFLFVGAHNTGKSSVINNIIGYNLNFLPTDLKECTKVGIIIKYVKNIKKPRMYKAKFITTDKNYNYFKYKDIEEDEEIKLPKKEEIEEKKEEIKEQTNIRSNSVHDKSTETKSKKRKKRKKNTKNDTTENLPDRENKKFQSEILDIEMTYNAEASKIMEDIDNDQYPIVGKDEIWNKINKLNNLENIKNVKLKFYVIESPIELLDNIEIDESIKEKIELIDFPGLDTRFEEAQNQSRTLLSIIEGFIHINSKIEYDNHENTKIINLIYNTIKSRDSFDFNTCLFILNKIDQLEKGGKEIKLNDMKNKIIKIINENNSSLPSQEWYKLKDKIKDSKIIMTKFSSLLYQQYKNFEINIENFEKFILKNAYKDKKKTESLLNNFISNFSDLIKPDDDFIDIINDNLIKKYMIIDPKFKPKKKDMDEYYQRLVTILKPYDKDYKIPNKKEQLREIVKNYLYLRDNKEKHKFYENSYYNLLARQYGIIVQNSALFFDEKRVNDVLNYMIDCYIAIIEVLKRVELSIRGDTNSEFKNINIKEVIYEITTRYENYKNDIENEFKNKKAMVDKNIERDFSKKNFSNLVKENNKLIADLKEYVDTKCKAFSDFIKHENQKIIDNLNLKSLEEEKTKFLENMKKFKGEKMGESNDTSDVYYKTGSFLFFSWFDSGASKQCYQDAIDQYFSENRDNILQNLNNNRYHGETNITRIYDVFIDNINGLKKNFNFFEEIVKDIEGFIYKLFGITD